MRLATIKQQGQETAALVLPTGVVTFEQLNKTFNQQWTTNLLELMESDQLSALNHWFQDEFQQKTKEESFKELILPFDQVSYAPLYRRPQKIWGIGLNYVEHAADLHEVSPSTEPASFMKPATTIIGPGETIQVPLQSERTTAESELGIIIGKTCKDVSEENALDVVAGYTTIIDMTAEDILQKNPRYLTRAKSFDTFFSFGPHLVTPDEVDDVLALKVATMINGEVHRENTVSNMTFQPQFLISFHSKVMTLLPGDIISTGTPGAVVIRQGDVVGCRIDGFEPLENPVEDLKG
ncbi:2-keto-4-pentenoate hydratase/2-oxohepta-3-ene-1,7-dioic acid hydratase in catechol pathway [Planomicrobium stackebrandtii]|uniref:2-keto-4-pentenoate hydratase/2-oxohepta-3-ene-1,7-dioic acid hydratase in catechol pathway n=1 Tax=Planomicrobium stackebrandtii TaxID=253160 RepID=A0ABU0GVJ1_9BACL|nr:fumarylacetoacetate hydrolase family protein [Planomicrobium stackebrandtii]MDQ0429377.1 2-keto-4-pentenoate hydratase/2-oxohepta-3-ene-1,7-dioic acid hydratase in catechol pathway [Planomicrobium stackebrandtii]